MATEVTTEARAEKVLADMRRSGGTDGLVITVSTTARANRVLVVMAAGFEWVVERELPRFATAMQLRKELGRQSSALQKLAKGDYA